MNIVTLPEYDVNPVHMGLLNDQIFELVKSQTRVRKIDKKTMIR
jgi:hypothetical protein